MVWLIMVAVSLRLYDDPLELLHFLLVVTVLPVVIVLALGTNRTLRGSVSRHQRLVSVMADSSDSLLWECDLQGNVLFVNDRLMAHFGYSAGEAHGLNLTALIHPQELSRLGHHLASGVGWRNERWRCLHKDGTERWFSGCATVMTSEDGTIIGYTGISQLLGSDALDELRLSALAAGVYQRLGSRDIEPVFQPILSVKTGRLVGAEALSRFPGSDRNPEQWFVGAAEVGLAVELELAALQIALAAAIRLPADIYVSVNVSPATLDRPALLEAVTRADIAPDRIVLEVTEHATIEDYGSLLPAIEALRAAGVRIAVDDAGAGYASFRHVLRLAPEFIKLDRSLVSNIHSNRAQRALAAAVVAFGLEMQATIIAEGIETNEELRCMQSLGIDAAQGYLFGRPTGDWTTWSTWHRRGPLYSVAAAHAAPLRD